MNQEKIKVLKIKINKNSTRRHAVKQEKQLIPSKQ